MAKEKKEEKIDYRAPVRKRAEKAKREEEATKAKK